MDDKPGSRNADGIYEPFRIEAVPVETWSQGARFGSSVQALGEFGGRTQIGVHLEVLPPGRQSCPAHYHMLEEEHVMVLEGSVTLRLGERTYELTAGHYACFPAGQKAAHALINRSDAPCRYLVIGNRNPNEVVVYPDSGKVGVRLMGERYPLSPTLPYWDGEHADTAP
jgi:uncharacterized cupin superfamily protein